MPVEREERKRKRKKEKRKDEVSERCHRVRCEAAGQCGHLHWTRRSAARPGRAVEGGRGEGGGTPTPLAMYARANLSRWSGAVVSWRCREEEVGAVGRTPYDVLQWYKSCTLSHVFLFFFPAGAGAISRAPIYIILTERERETAVLKRVLPARSRDRPVSRSLLSSGFHTQPCAERRWTRRVHPLPPPRHLS